MDRLDKRIVKLAAMMAEHTRPECARCRIPHGCCSADHCFGTKAFARRAYGITLDPVQDDIPFLGPTGCVVEPHLRPICTVHTCEVCSLGYKRDDDVWTDRYFRLRNRLMDAYFDRFGSSIWDRYFGEIDS